MRQLKNVREMTLYNHNENVRREKYDTKFYM